MEVLSSIIDGATVMGKTLLLMMMMYIVNLELHYGNFAPAVCACFAVIMVLVALPFIHFPRLLVWLGKSLFGFVEWNHRK